jgi:hypothetical protein
MSADDMDASVQTLERPEPDLFGDGSPPAQRLHAAASLTFSGRLAHRPHIASRTLGNGHTVPVIVLELDDVGAGHHRVVAHIPFTEATRDQAERQARALQRDQVVTVTTSLIDVRLFLPAASLSPDQPH